MNKKIMARQKPGADMRTKRVTVRFTPANWKLLKDRAELEGLAVAAFIAQAALGTMRKREGL